MSVKEGIKNAQVEVEKLRNRLNAVNQEKEAEYHKKEEVSKSIQDKIQAVKVSKIERNKLSSEVRRLKQERDKRNVEIKKKIDEIKELKKNFEGVRKPAKRDGKKPINAPREIEKLEFKLETVPMNMDAEKKLMKRIKELKKEIGDVGENKTLNKGIRTLSKEIDKMKKDADSVHEQIQKKAVGSQKHHEILIKESKDIKELKKQEEKLYKDFLKKKEEYVKINRDLKDKLEALRLLSGENKKEKQKAKQAKAKRVAEDQARSLEEAEEKLKRKKKLTTEDLLMLQKNE